MEPGLSPGLPLSGLITKGEVMAELVTLLKLMLAIIASLSSSSRCSPDTMVSSSLLDLCSASWRALVSSICFLSIIIRSPLTADPGSPPGTPELLAVLVSSVEGLAELELAFLLDLMTASLLA